MNDIRIIPRLRASEKVYENLLSILKCIKKHKCEAFDKDKCLLKNFHKDMNDIKSTLRQFDLIDKNCNLTKFGEKILYLQNKEDVKKHLFLHFFYELNGVFYIIPFLINNNPKSRNDIKENIELLYNVQTQKEFTDISKINIFLKWTGVFIESSKKYKLDIEKLNEFLSYKLNKFIFLEKLTQDEKYILKFLLKKLLESSSNEIEVSANEIKKGIEELYNHSINIHNFQSYIKKLEKIKCPDGTQIISLKSKKGRGKSSSVIINNVSNECFELIKKLYFTNFDPFRLGTLKEYKDLLTDLESNNTYEKGKALEFLAARLALDIGLKNIQIRGSAKTTKSEIDVSGEINYPFKEIVNIQCKNQEKSVDIDVIYREIIEANLNEASRIIIFSMSGYSRRVYDLLPTLENKYNIKIYLFDKDDIMKMGNKEVSVIDLIKQKDEEKFYYSSKSIIEEIQNLLRKFTEENNISFS